jgi:hypothetical protein
LVKLGPEDYNIGWATPASSAALVTFAPAAGIQATNVQAAIEELVTDVGIGYVTLGTAQTIVGKKTWEGATTGADALAARVVGDTQDRWVLNHDGSMEWGSGSGAATNTLGRSGAAVMEWGGNVQFNQYVGHGMTPGSGFGILNNLGSAYGVLTLASAATAVPLAARGAASQTANIQQWQNSAGTPLSWITAAGNLNIADGVVVSNVASDNAAIHTYWGLVLGGHNRSAGAPAGYGNTVAHVLVPMSTNSPTAPGLVVRQAPAGTANLQEWRNSAGTPLVSIAAAGVVSIDAGNVTNSGGLIISNLGAGYTGLKLQGQGSRRLDITELNDTSQGITLTTANNGFQIYNTAVATAFGTRITGSDAGIPRLVVKGATSQSASLQEWQNSAGTALVTIQGGGALVSMLGVYAGNWISHIGLGTGSPNNYFGSAAAAHVPVEVRGAASQTANLQEWKNSAGTVLSKVHSDGQITIPVGSIINYGAQYIWNSSGLVYGVTSGNAHKFEINSAQVATIAGGAAGVKLTLKGEASQTANLQEWQTSTGALRGAVSETGAMFQGVITGQAIGGGSTHFYSTFDNGGIMGSTIQWRNYTTPNVNINAVAAGHVAFQIRGATSQTADLQQWQDSGGTVLTKVAANGGMTIANSLAVPFVQLNNASGAYYPQTGSSYALLSNASPNTLLQAANAAHVPLAVKGAAAQTADLQRWQDSAGTTVANLLPSGAFTPFYISTTSGAAQLGYPGANPNVLTAWSAAGPGLIVKAAASQTADIQQWQNSAAAVLVTVGAKGSLYASTSDSTWVVAQFRGAASHTADLTQWQNSAGTMRASITANGTLRTPTIEHTNNSNAYIDVATGGGIGIENRTTVGNVVFSVKGMTSQSGNLTEWRDSAATVLFAIDAGGFPKWTAAKAQTTVGAAGGASALPATPTKYLQVKDSAGTTLIIPAYAAA